MSDSFRPKLVGEVSTLNTYVVVENHLPGTTLKILSDGTTLIGTKTNSIGGRDQVIIDPPFLPLTEGASLTATQEESGGPPSYPSLPIKVKRAVPSHGRFDGIIYRCVDFVRVSGLTEGSAFEVHEAPASGTSPASRIGQGTTYNGWADVSLTRPVSNSMPLTLRQIVGPANDFSTYPIPIIPVPVTVPGKLPRLTIFEASDCGWFARIAGTITGVEVEISRVRDGSIAAFVGRGWDGETQFWLPDPFRADDLVTSDQQMLPRCEMENSDESNKYRVMPRVIYPPLIVGPVCLDADELELMNVEPGAGYAVYAIFKTASGDKQRVVGRGQFPVPLDVPDRTTGMNPTILINRVGNDPEQLPNTVPSLFITQTACSWTSSSSPPVEMQPLGAPPKPELPDKLLACGVYVRVTKVRPGSWVSLHSKHAAGDPITRPDDGRIGLGHATASEISLYVPSGLNEGDTVWARAAGCQDQPSYSDTAGVGAIQGLLQAHIIDPVYPIDHTVVVEKLIVGAQIFARVVGSKHPGGQQFHKSEAWAPEVEVFVGDVFEGDTITIFQSLCHANATENQSNTVTVTLGTMVVSIAPTEVTLGSNSTILVKAADPARGYGLVNGDVLINGTKVGSTNVAFAWAAPASGSTQAVQIQAAGYKTWSGAIALKPAQTTPPKSGGTGSGPPPKKKMASYSYSCKSLFNGVEFTITGLDFPPGSHVTITPQYDGIFTAYGVTHICGEGGSTGPFGPFMADAAGKFAATVTVYYGCQSTCSVRLFASCDKLLPSEITDPKGPYCKCSP